MIRAVFKNNQDINKWDNFYRGDIVCVFFVAEPGNKGRVYGKCIVKHNDRFKLFVKAGVIFTFLYDSPLVKKIVRLRRAVR